MAKEGTTRKELFTIIGTFKEVDNEHRFVPSSPTYFRAASKRAPLGVPVAVTFSTKIPSRSRAQLAYHYVILGFLSEYTGYTVDELHDSLMRMKFGVKDVVLNGQTTQVRRSVSDMARFPKEKMAELIEYDLEVCRDMGVDVPTAESLGYISN
jgi:hypothetical protein